MQSKAQQQRRLREGATRPSSLSFEFFFSIRFMAKREVIYSPRRNFFYRRVRLDRIRKLCAGGKKSNVFDKILKSLARRQQAQYQQVAKRSVAGAVRASDHGGRVHIARRQLLRCRPSPTRG
jgi:hypothetical protein